MIRVRLALLVLAFAGLVVTGCATKILRPGGETEYLISCSGFGWHDCYARANQFCPTGYSTLSEDGEVIHNELRISCPSQSRSHDSRG